MFGDFGLDWAPTSLHSRGLQGGELIGINMHLAYRDITL